MPEAVAKVGEAHQIQVTESAQRLTVDRKAHIVTRAGHPNDGAVVLEEVAFGVPFVSVDQAHKGVALRVRKLYRVHALYGLTASDGSHIATPGDTRRLPCRRCPITRFVSLRLVSSQTLAPLREEHAAIAALRDATLIASEQVEDHLETAIALLEDPADLYLRAKPTQRRALNRWIWRRIEVGDDDEILGAKTGPFPDAFRPWQPGLGVVRHPAGARRVSVCPPSASVHLVGEGPGRSDRGLRRSGSQGVGDGREALGPEARLQRGQVRG
jgi:hypothetical protein